MDNITQLFPQPVQELPLEGAYLAHDLRQYTQQSGKPFVYTNFVVSLDGRIAIARPEDKGLTVPKATANDRDWRLFQELAAQADLIISTGRYLREWVEGKAQEILEVDNPKFTDLRDWRSERGLSPQPDIAIVSHGLDFPIPPELSSGGRKFVIVTTMHANPARVEDLRAQGIRVIVAGEDSVDGAEMVAQMAGLGYKTIYSTAGPNVMHLLAASRVLNRLYLTHANRLLGGHPFASVVEGTRFDPPLDCRINTIYLDPHGLDGLGQLFISYDVEATAH